VPWSTPSQVGDLLVIGVYNLAAVAIKRKTENQVHLCDRPLGLPS